MKHQKKVSWLFLDSDEQFNVFPPGLQGKGGGERVLQVFEEQLPSNMNAQPFQQLLSIQSVKRIIQDSDGYQPFLVAPENGYRALVKEGVKLMEPPCAAAVDAVDMVLRDVGQKVRRPRPGSFACFSGLKALRGERGLTLRRLSAVVDMGSAGPLPGARFPLFSTY